MSLEKIGQLAVDLHHANAERKRAKQDLRNKYHEFAALEGLAVPSGTILIDKHHRLYGSMQAFAAEEVKAYARAKLDEYNLKRKLNRAIQSLGRESKQEDVANDSQIDMDEVWSAATGSVSDAAAVE